MRRIALVGTTGSGADAPYDDLNYEIWGCSSRMKYVTRATRWFELHRFGAESKAWADGWRKLLKMFTGDLELMMFYPEPDLGPKVTQYPTERITSRFGTYFMQSSFSWMMALAIDEMCPQGEEWEPGEIALFGVEMEYETEYQQQRAGLRHFIDLAKVMGITVTRLTDSGISYEPVPYPFWQDDPLMAKLEKRTKANSEKLTNLDAGIKNTRTMIAENNAIDNELGRFIHPLIHKFPESEERTAALVKVAARQQGLENELKELYRVSKETSIEIVTLEGAREEMRWFKDYLSP